MIFKDFFHQGWSDLKMLYTDKEEEKCHKEKKKNIKCFLALGYQLNIETKNWKEEECVLQVPSRDNHIKNS